MPGSHWSEDEHNALLDFLSDYFATFGTSGSLFEFPDEIWEQAREKLVVRPVSGYKTKWKRYGIVSEIQANFGWHDTNGADIGPADAERWKIYVAGHQDSSPFRNTGWVLFKKVRRLMASASTPTPGTRPSDQPRVRRRLVAERPRTGTGSVPNSEVESSVPKSLIVGLKYNAKDAIEDEISVFTPPPSKAQKIDDDDDVVFVVPSGSRRAPPHGTVAATRSSQRKQPPATDTTAVPASKRQRSSPPEATHRQNTETAAPSPSVRKSRTETSRPVHHSVASALLASSRPRQGPACGNFAANGSSQPRQVSAPDIAAAPAAKRRRISSPELPHNVDTLVPDPSARMTQAMKRVQRLETTLSDRCIVALVDLFQTDITAADAYLSLEREGVRKVWIENRVKHIMEEEEELL